MSTYQALRLFSITAGCDIVRISMCDDKGGEFFANIPDDSGFKVMRQRREDALDLIMDAIARGDDPGEIIL